MSDHVESNRRYWGAQAADYVEAARRNWADRRDVLGHLGRPGGRRRRACGDVDGLDVIELGCGTAYWSRVAGAPRRAAGRDRHHAGAAGDRAGAAGRARRSSSR